jgi:hypothetical protein
MRSLWSVTLGGKSRLLHTAPASLTLWDIAADGLMLMSRDEDRRAIVGRAPGDTMERDLSWFDDSGVAGISEDGQVILLRDRFGLYVRRTDGSQPTKVHDEGFGDDISRDKKTILATIDQLRTLVLVPREVGEPKRLPRHGIEGYRGARFLPGGRVLFVGLEKDVSRSYVQDIEGGAPPRAITPPSVWAQAVSPDGTQVAAISDGQPITLWPVDGKSAMPITVRGSEAGDRPVAWSDDGRALWLFRRSEVPGHVYKLDIGTGRRTPVKELTPPDGAGVYSITEFATTPSGHAYAYTYTRQLSQLYLANGIR